MIYFYIPVTLFVLLNLGLYLATVVRLSMHNRQTRIVRQSRRLNAGTGNDESVFGKDAMEELILFTKLFLVLGIFWIFSCLHYLSHGNHKSINCQDYSEAVEIFFRKD